MGGGYDDGKGLGFDDGILPSELWFKSCEPRVPEEDVLVSNIVMRNLIILSTPLVVTLSLRD